MSNKVAGISTTKSVTSAPSFLNALKAQGKLENDPPHKFHQLVDSSDIGGHGLTEEEPQARYDFDEASKNYDLLTASEKQVVDPLNALKANTNFENFAQHENFDAAVVGKQSELSAMQNRVAAILRTSGYFRDFSKMTNFLSADEKAFVGGFNADVKNPALANPATQLQLRTLLFKTYDRRNLLGNINNALQVNAKKKVLSDKNAVILSDFSANPQKLADPAAAPLVEKIFQKLGNAKADITIFGRLPE